MENKERELWRHQGSPHSICQPPAQLLSGTVPWSHAGVVRVYVVEQVVLEQPAAEAVLWASCGGNAKQ